MTKLTQGNLLAAPVEALVNTVNTVGIMGRGIALQFKQVYPEMFRDYERAPIQIAYLLVQASQSLWLVYIYDAYERSFSLTMSPNSSAPPD